MSYDEEFERTEAEWFEAPAEAAFKEYVLSQNLSAYVRPRWHELHETSKFIWKEIANAALKAAEARGERPLYNNPDPW